MTFPLHRQVEPRDCGPTCLKMVAQYHGIDVSAARLRELCDQGRHGVSLLGLIRGAERIGLQATGIRSTFQHLRDAVPFPCIVQWTGGHVVVVHRIDRDQVSVADPARGLRTMDVGEFLEGWLPRDLVQGAVLVIRPAGDAKEESADPSGRSPGATLFRAIRGRLSLFVLAVLVVAEELLRLAPAVVLVPLLDVLLVPAGAGAIMLWAGVVAVLILARGGTAVGIQVARAGVHDRAAIETIGEDLERLVSRPLRFFFRRPASAILERVADRRRLDGFLTGTFLDAVRDGSTVLGAFALWLRFSPPSAFLYLGATTTSLAVEVWALRLNADLDARRATAMQRIQRHTKEIVNGIVDLRASGADRAFLTRWRRSQEELRFQGRRGLPNDIFAGVVPRLIHWLGVAGALLLVGLRARSGDATAAELAGAALLSGLVWRPPAGLRRLKSDLVELRKRLVRLSEAEASPESPEVADGAPMPEGDDLVLDDVLVLRHDGSGLPSFGPTTMRFAAGRTTLVVTRDRPAGSALLRVLAGLDAPDRGRVCAGDLALASVAPESRRRAIGICLREGTLFSGTVALNVAPAALDDGLDEVRLRETLERVGLGHWLRNLPMGAETAIDSETVAGDPSLRQRLLLARALYRDPAYLLIDDSADPLGSTADQKPLEAVSERRRGRTVVIVSGHRRWPSVDRVLELTGGRLVERPEWLPKCGPTGS